MDLKNVIQILGWKREEVLDAIRKGRNTVSIQTNKFGFSDYRGLEEEDWEYPNLSVNKAKEILNELLALTALKDYTYRKGLGYVLRRQSDYDDVFRLSRFSAGRDINWKPFVAMLLGFDNELIENKYELDANIEDLENFKKKLEEQAQMSSGEIDKLTGIIEIKERELERNRLKIDEFDFYELEDEISESTVEKIETEISELNKTRYHFQNRLQNIKNALTSNFEFEPEKIQKLFHEMNVLLPDALINGYENLVEFNRKLTSGRIERLQDLQDETYKELSEINLVLESLNGERAVALKALENKKTLEKYREFLQRLRDDESEIATLKERLAKLDSVAVFDTQKEALNATRKNVVHDIKAEVRQGNPTYKNIREFFSNAFSSIVNAYAIMSVSVNTSDNLEFEIQTLDRNRGNKKTSEGKGFSYKKLLCVCFDLALVANYSNDSFYKFVYHDGVFESLDNRKKVALIDLIRDTCNSESIQYILTVIDTDLPRDEMDSKLLFNSKEIVRELHDDGDDGRLFRMESF
ncbi:MAG: hypothetical protein CME32_22545 [Gimesia sp.]|nr:hypothetical protein [Gimesia sp.]